ncbi:serine/threonine protein kinase [bacterium]|nr:serine/threonine protein kinase [bacterium]
MDQSHIRQYRLSDRLGAGRHGETWMAIDEALQRPVTLKFLPSTLVTDAGFREQFAESMRRLNALKHPALAAFFTIDTETDRPFIVREYITGKPLRAFTNGEPMFYGEFLDLAIQLADLLQSAHVEEVALVNISPGNIIVDDDQKVRIVDACLPWDSNPEETSEAVIDAARYRAPEQLTRGPIEVGSDLFSLGAVFFEMLTGEEAFDGETFGEVTTAVSSIPISFESPVARRIPHEGKLLLERMTACDVSDRLSALSLLASLQEMREQHTRQVTGVAQAEERSPGSPRRLLILSIIALILIIIWFIVTFNAR